MQRYLKVVRDTLGSFGVGYRGIGDEVLSVVMGQGHAGQWNLLNRQDTKSKRWLRKHSDRQKHLE
jgi:hypothetical protein